MNKKNMKKDFFDYEEYKDVSPEIFTEKLDPTGMAQAGVTGSLAEDVTIRAIKEVSDLVISNKTADPFGLWHRIYGQYGNLCAQYCGGSVHNGVSLNGGSVKPEALISTDENFFNHFMLEVKNQLSEQNAYERCWRWYGIAPRVEEIMKRVYSLPEKPIVGILWIFHGELSNEKMIEKIINQTVPHHDNYILGFTGVNQTTIDKYKGSGVRIYTMRGAIFAARDELKKWNSKIKIL